MNETYIHPFSSNFFQSSKELHRKNRRAGPGSAFDGKTEIDESIIHPSVHYTESLGTVTQNISWPYSVNTVELELPLFTFPCHLFTCDKQISAQYH